MFSLRHNNKKRYYIPEDRVTNPFWAYNPEIKSFGDTYFNFGSHVVPRKSENEKFFIPEDISEREIVGILKNTKIAGRSFFGYEKKIAEVVARAKNRRSAISDLSVLLNSDNKSLKASDIYKFLLVLTTSENTEDKNDFVMRKAV